MFVFSKFTFYQLYHIYSMKWSDFTYIFMPVIKHFYLGNLNRVHINDKYLVTLAKFLAKSKSWCNLFSACLQTKGQHHMVSNVM